MRWNGLLLWALTCLWCVQAGVRAQEIDQPPPALRDAGPRAGLAEAYGRIASTGDDWRTEQFHEAAKKQLNVLATALATGRGLGAEELSALLAAGCEVTPPRPPRLVPANRGEGILVARAVDGIVALPVTGAESVAAAFNEWRRALAPDGASLRVGLKIDAVTRAPVTEGAAVERWSTQVRVHVGGVGTQAARQANAIWLCHWQAAADGPPRLDELIVREYEEVELPFGRALFADCTRAVLGAQPSYAALVLPSMNHWRGSLDRQLGVGLHGYHGVALGDFDGDGRDDLYLCQPGGVPNLLYRTTEAGTLVEHAGQVDYQEPTRAALFVDLDNDGDQDLAVLTVFHLLLHENDGAGQFTRRQVLATPMAMSLSATDVDADGRLDLYVCCYDSLFDRKPPLPYHDANNGSPNYLLHNDGDWQFLDITARVGLDVNNRRFSFAAAWEDFDNDGDQDLYVANDFGRNNLYRNDGEAGFVDVAASAGVEDISAGMGVTWGDYDGDGWMDLHVSNMYSSAGGRIAYQDRFQNRASAETRTQLQRHARGNSLFRNNGDGTFTDASVAAGIVMGRWAWGSVFTDLDNDGGPDLVVPNGFITNEQPRDL